MLTNDGCSYASLISRSICMLLIAKYNPLPAYHSYKKKIEPVYLCPFHLLPIPPPPQLLLMTQILS